MSKENYLSKLSLILGTLSEQQLARILLFAQQLKDEKTGDKESPKNISVEKLDYDVNI